MLLFEGSSETGLFRHLSNYVFWSPFDQKYISCEDHLFLKKILKIESKFRKVKKKKMEKKFFVSKIISSEDE